ncbi:MAG: hypothetical protein HY710_04090, partial [Candidatus Latescibacteria bacterium]|nr:hypothetical protein [Candidatus Latescibacterota bacterium]
MHDLVARLLDHRLSRRGFIRGVAATGLTLHTLDAVLTHVEASDARVSRSRETCRTVTGTGGALLVEQLKAAGVEYVFANPGSTEVGLFDALADATGLPLIIGLHEGIVISMAHGYHQATGQPAFVNVHAIVGTAQMSGQLYNAHRDRAAIVVTAGLVDPALRCDDVDLAPRPGSDQVDV